MLALQFVRSWELLGFIFMSVGVILGAPGTDHGCCRGSLERRLLKDFSGSLEWMVLRDFP